MYRFCFRCESVCVFSLCVKVNKQNSPLLKFQRSKSVHVRIFTHTHARTRIIYKKWQAKKFRSFANSSIVQNQIKPIASLSFRSVFPQADKKLPNAQYARSRRAEFRINFTLFWRMEIYVNAFLNITHWRISLPAFLRR